MHNNQEGNSSSQRHHSSTSSHPLVFTPSPIKSSSARSSISPSYQTEHPQGPFSSRSYSSDSSFDDSVVPGLTKDAVSNSFSHSDSASQRFKSEGLRTSLFKKGSGKATTTSDRDDVSVSASRHSSGNASERPGLFSNSFSFFTTEPSAGDSASQYSSPGKENTSNPVLNQTSSSSSVHISRDDRPVETASVDTVSSSSAAAVQLVSSVGRSRVQESSSVRKRPGDISQPLEKIPSPNSRKGELIINTTEML